LRYPEEDSSSRFNKEKGITVSAIKIRLTQIKHTDKSEKKKSIRLKDQNLNLKK
jgi:hypothetical protein